MKRMAVALVLALGIHALLLLTPVLHLQNTLVSPRPQTPTQVSLHMLPPVPAMANIEPILREMPPQAPAPVPPIPVPTPKSPQPVAVPAKTPEKPVKPQTPDVTVEALPPETMPSPDSSTNVTSQPADANTSDETEPSQRFTDQTPAESSVQSVSAPGQVSRDAEPRYKENPDPDYPMVARRRGYQGTVVLEVSVDTAGNAGEVRILASSGHILLDQSALEAVRTWRFHPAIRNSEPVAARVTVPVTFELQ